MLKSSMNNRFKFRVWDKLAKRMIYPHNDNQQHFIIDLNGRFHNLQNGSGGDDYVIQQYTVLNDKNGIPIYEGDILSTYMNDVDTNKKGVVTRAISGAYTCIYNYISSDEDESKLFTHFVISVAHESVVVGNIFEDAELSK